MEEKMAEHQVAINNMRYNPASITISSGDIVVWTNQMGFAHTVTPDNGEFQGSGRIPAQGKFSHTFSAAGSVAYHCEIHPAMKGTVIVT
jgi:plastocyanin